MDGPHHWQIWGRGGGVTPFWNYNYVQRRKSIYISRKFQAQFSSNFAYWRHFARILRTHQRPTTDQRPHIWENFKLTYLCEGSSDPLNVWFYGGVFEVGGSNGAISGFAKSKILENSNGDISAADRPIYSMFGSRMGFSGSADRMALIPVWPNSIGMWEKTMREE